MSPQAMSDDPPHLAGLHHSDGLRVLVDRGTAENEISLALGFCRGGVLVPPPFGGKTDDEESLVYTVARWENPKAKDYGQRVRLQWLLEAICRFINTGGSWIDVENVPLLAKVFSGEFTAEFGDFDFIGTHIDDDGDIEHLFAKPGCPKGVAWVEGAAVMEVDLSDYLDEIKDGRQRDS